MSKAKWRNQYTQIPGQSKFHEAVRKVLTTNPILKRMKCWQEVNVQELVPSYDYNNHHFDWYIEELNLIMELHGQQHYEMVNFGNIGYDEAMRAFRKLQNRDNSKKTAAEEAGYRYIAIPYMDLTRVTSDVLCDCIFGED